MSTGTGREVARTESGLGAAQSILRRWGRSASCLTGSFWLDVKSRAQVIQRKEGQLGRALANPEPGGCTGARACDLPGPALKAEATE